MAKPTGKIPPKPGKETVYVDVDDEITSIIDKVDAAKEQIVALVLPKRSTTLQSIVNMRLLRRSADNSGKSVVLITRETALLPLAGAAGLHVAESLQAKPEVPPSPIDGAPESKTEDIPADEGEIDENSAKLDYHRSIGELATAHSEEDEAEEIALGEEGKTEEKTAKASKTPKASKIKVPNFDRFRILLGLGILALIAIIVFIVLAVAVLPKATITVQTTSLPVVANLTLNASDATKTLDETGGNIPAALKSSDQTSTESIQATGQQNNGNKASGSVTMTAEKCSGNPFVNPSDVPAGTGISANGLTYITQEDASFHGTGTSGGCFTYAAGASIDITGQSAGTKFNVSNATFSVADRSDVSANGSASGGTDSIVTVVSQADVDNAQSKVSSSDASTFSKTFETQLSSQGLYVLTSTLKAGTPVVTPSPAVGQPASTVTVTIKTTYTVLTLQASDLQKAITDALKKQINAKEQQLNNTNVLTSASVNVQSQGSPTTATLIVSEDTTAEPILNIANIKQQSVGQKSGDITAAINNLPGVKSVTVKFSPFWVSKAPKVTKITVVQQQVKSGS